MKKRINKLSNESYHYRTCEDHPSHRELRRTRNKYGEVIVLAKRKHWTDYLEHADTEDIWTVNCYIKEPTGDSSNPRIPTLKTINTDGSTSEVNTNDSKAKAFSDAFFPKPPQTSSVPVEYDYPDPLPDPPPITPEQIEAQIRRLSPYKASGPDEIPNIILQKSYDLIADYLLH